MKKCMQKTSYSYLLRKIPRAASESKLKPFVKNQFDLEHLRKMARIYTYEYGAFCIYIIMFYKTKKNYFESVQSVNNSLEITRTRTQSKC